MLHRGLAKPKISQVSQSEPSDVLPVVAIGHDDPFKKTKTKQSVKNNKTKQYKKVE
jgi:hypothetical protein